MSVKKQKANNLKISEQVKIKTKTALLGLTFAEIDRKYDLTSGAARDALRVPVNVQLKLIRLWHLKLTCLLCRKGNMTREIAAIIRAVC
jgi:hypothetical protein